jgi:hypothetical protein
VLDEAAARLAELRGLPVDDPEARLHLDASLVLGLRIRIAGTAAALHERDVSWKVIATLLGVSERAAIARFSEVDERRERRRR